MSGSVTGRAMCNSYSGTYRLLGDGQLLLEGFSSTDVFCGSGADQFEATFLGYLSAVNRYEHRAGSLLLVTSSHDSLRFGPL